CDERALPRGCVVDGLRVVECVLLIGGNEDGVDCRPSHPVDDASSLACDCPDTCGGRARALEVARGQFEDDTRDVQSLEEGGARVPERQSGLERVEVEEEWVVPQAREQLDVPAG